jgi:hypothetical protein
MFEPRSTLPPHFLHSFAIYECPPSILMSAGRSLGLQNRDRLRQWLPSQRGSNSASNASVSSGNEGDYASSALPGPSSSSQLIEKGPKQNPKPRKRDRFLKFFERSPSDHPPKLKPFKRSTLERDLAVLSTTYLMEDCHSLKELILAIVALSAQCNDEKVSFISHGIYGYLLFSVLVNRAPSLSVDAPSSAFV